MTHVLSCPGERLLEFKKRVTYCLHLQKYYVVVILAYSFQHRNITDDCKLTQTESLDWFRKVHTHLGHGQINIQLTVDALNDIKFC